MQKNLAHNGQLKLRFGVSGSRTAMTDCLHLSPLKASRSLYLNNYDPAEASVYMVQASGCLMAGDTNRIEIKADKGAHVCMRPQSATLVYPSENGLWSSQDVVIDIDEEAKVSWKIESTIPFHRSKYNGSTVVNMKSTSTFLWGDILTPGRIHRDELFEYNEFKNKFKIYVDGKLVVLDPMHIVPSEYPEKEIGLLEDKIFIGTLWYVSPHVAEIDVEEVRGLLTSSKDIKSGLSSLDGRVINIRWMASDLILLKKEMHRVWDLLNNKN